MHPDSICTRDNPKKTTKKGRRLVAFSTRARVRASSNMGPTFNATDTRKTGYERQRNARLSPAAVNHFRPYAIRAARRDPLNKMTCSRPAPGGFQTIDWK